MESWDKYCGISKNARSILSSIEPALVQANPQTTQPQVSWRDTVESSLSKYFDDISKSYEESAKLAALLQKLNIGKEGIVGTSKIINEKCAQLLKERENLVALNSSIQSKYFYYVHLESLSSQIICLTRDPTSLKKRFAEIFAQIEDAIEFFTENPHYIDSTYYLTEYETLLDSWTDAFTNILSKNFQIFYAYYDNFFKTAPGFEEIHKIFRQFSISPGKYSDTYYMTNTIISSYFKIRSKHVTNVLNNSIDSVKSEISISKQSETACKILEHFWKKEIKLFAYYFSEDFSQETIKQFFFQYSNPIYEALRENLIQETRVEELSLASSLLQDFTQKAKLSVFNNLFEDIQERIIYAVTLYINEAIIPGPSKDDIHPAVVNTIRLFKILHMTINNEIFDSLAGETISSCVLALNNSLDHEDFIEAHVFIIKNLLELRKNMECMGIDIKDHQYKELDYTDTKRLFWKLVMGEVSLIKKGVFAELVHSGVPKFSNKDTKNIENEISSRCQSFIIKTFHEIANPILLLIEKMKETGGTSYEIARRTLEDSTNRISLIFPRFCSAVFMIMEEKNCNEMILNVSAQVLKAFQQLISLMESNFSNMPLPSITDIQLLLQNPHSFE
ncbi:hypothetical protein SteCoe_22539 [Stentor coeruleus]|uniref:Conserved oligomeric Golgi complex subunit 3 n=1 Tax=Stentor coeruleus TaxID=5963 RepID=A0A1R2BLT6_9CILI|nr:hypothetical protein SteCoe_22539 [Stentor coeruleus]